MLSNFSVKENIELFKDIYPSFKDNKVKLGIDNLYNKKVNKLSNGEKQRVCVYISICVNEEIILLDEPTSSLDEINKDMVDSLKELEPFGEENKTPLFVFKNLKIDSIRALSEGKHLKLTLKDNKNIVNAIGFNLGELSNDYRIGDKVDVVGNINTNDVIVGYGTTEQSSVLRLAKGIVKGGAGSDYLMRVTEMNLNFSSGVATVDMTPYLAGSSFEKFVLAQMRQAQSTIVTAARIEGTTLYVQATALSGTPYTGGAWVNVLFLMNI
mgnify:CR=1 FL=1